MHENEIKWILEVFSIACSSFGAQSDVFPFWTERVLGCTGMDVLTGLCSAADSIGVWTVAVCSCSRCLSTSRHQRLRLECGGLWRCYWKQKHYMHSMICCIVQIHAFLGSMCSLTCLHNLFKSKFIYVFLCLFMIVQATFNWVLMCYSL